MEALERAFMLEIVLSTLNLLLLLTVMRKLQALLRKTAAAPAPEDGKDTLQRLREAWLKEVRPPFEPAVLQDPLLSPPAERLDALLSRFLEASRDGAAHEDAALQIAIDRLRSTAAFRRDYKATDFHRPGMARALFMHKSNPGASMYFGDAGLRTRTGEIVLVGRTSLMVESKAAGRKPADNVIPGPHLRAALFVIERAVCEACARGQKASYILDVGAYPAAEMKGRARYWDADGFVDDFAAVAQRRSPRPTVAPHLPHHASMGDGLPVLKEALALITSHYPDSLRRVWFYRPSLAFRAVFAVFRLWVPKKTRDKASRGLVTPIFPPRTPGPASRRRARPVRAQRLRPRSRPRSLCSCALARRPSRGRSSARTAAPLRTFLARWVAAGRRSTATASWRARSRTTMLRRRPFISMYSLPPTPSLNSTVYR